MKATSGKIKDTSYPEWTILLLLSQTLPLMENAIKMLATGYIRSSEIMVRVVGEAIILATYFKEFPETEKEYRQTNYRDFFHNHRMEKMLKKVEQEGKFFVRDVPNKKIKWNKIIFTNLYEEASRFVHNDPNMIYSLVKDNLSNDNNQHRLILGPQLYSDNILSMGLRRLFNSLLFSLVVLGVSLNIIPDDNERTIMDNSSKIIDDLNVKF